MKYKIEIYKNGSTKAPGPEMFFLSDWEKQYNLYTYVFIVKGNGHTILIDTGCVDIEAINKLKLSQSIAFLDSIYLNRASNIFLGYV